jgi:hypothetical protein
MPNVKSQRKIATTNYPDRKILSAETSIIDRQIANKSELI